MIYKTLAQECISEISSGKIPAHSRMPSLRNFKKQHNISMSSALNCYQHLESLGWIISKPQSGYFVSNRLWNNNRPEIVQFQSQTSDPKSALDSASYTPFIKHIGPLGYARIEPAQLPIEKLQQSFRRACKRQGDNISLYPEPQGENILRSSLSAHFNRYDIHFSADEWVITNGCMDAIKTALEITTEQGDAIAISSPCYSGLLDMLTLLDRKVIEIPSTTTGIDLEQLEMHMQNGAIKAGLFCTSHMNPQGTSMSAQQKQHLVALAETYQIPIIEDDVYIETAHDKVVPLPAKYWDKQGYVLWCGSVSKTLAAGYRLGWCLPGRYLQQYLTKRRYLNQSVASPVQLSIADFISNGEYLTHLKKMRFNLQKQTLDYHLYLRENLPLGSKISQPTGGFVLWIQIPKLDTNALFKKADLQQLDIRVGKHFSTLGHYQDCFRINIGYPLLLGEPNAAREQLDGLIAIVKSLLESIGEG